MSAAATRELRELDGVPDYRATEYRPRGCGYALLVPVINEDGRLAAELERARRAGVDAAVDIIICDGGSTDGSTEDGLLESRGVNTLLVKEGPGRQGAQLRMGIHFALERGYEAVLTIDGNNKDSIEDVGRLVAAIEDGFDLVQGSRFVRGGRAINTPRSRYLAVRLIHAPIISLAARHRFTDTTNAFRAYSRRYLADSRVQPLRDVFVGYELLAYLSVRATRIGLRACEVPVERAYPKQGSTPTKIKGARGNLDLMRCLFGALLGRYNP